MSNALKKLHICTNPLVGNKIKGVRFFGTQLTEHLGRIGMTKYRLAKESGVPESTTINIANSKRRPTDDNLEKFASVPGFDVPLVDLKAWRAIDDYGSEALLKAVEIAKDTSPEVVKRVLDAEDQRRGLK